MNIENLRRLRGLNQNDLAELTELSQPMISRAEKGDGGVTLRNYRRISAALNVPLAELFQESRSRIENELLDMFRTLPADRQHTWLDMSRIFATGHAGPSGEKPQNSRGT